MFCKRVAHINFAKFTGKHLFQSFFFNELVDLRAATLLRKGLWHRCFPVIFVNFVRTSFYRTPPVTGSVNRRNRLVPSELTHKPS